MSGSLYYQEVRGVMTRFEPLTEQAVLKYGEEGLTLTDVAEALAKHDLRLEYVLHDPTRSLMNTFYADYNRGLYSEILLRRSMLTDQHPFFSQAEQLRGQSVPALAAKEWNIYYGKYVPLQMLIYDFQRRYRDIAPEEVYSVWYRIYKRIDYSNGMWLPEVLEYVFSHAPKPVCPELDADGLVTIYRGMGELSLPPEQAISWSTHPGNALWFAIHCGQGTHIAVARIRPELIVGYHGTFYNENEVILRPGTVTEYHYEDMIPATKQEIPALLESALIDYIRFGREAKKLGYQEESIFHHHGLKHTLRVLLLSLIYFYNSDDKLSESDLRILICFSLLHDIGRTNEEKDSSHGERSVALIHTKGLRIKGLPMSKKEHRIAELLIQHHCHDDAAGEEAIRSAPWLSRKEKDHAIHLYHICKDMDGLDRVRFNGLDYRQLRTPYGHRLPLVAGALLEEQMVQVLEFDLENF